MSSIASLTEDAGATESKAGLNRILVTVCAMLAALKEVLDSTIANVALSHMPG